MAQTGVSVSWNVIWVTEVGIHGHSRRIHVCPVGIRQMTELTRKHAKYNIEAFSYTEMHLNIKVDFTKKVDKTSMYTCCPGWYMPLMSPSRMCCWPGGRPWG